MVELNRQKRQVLRRIQEHINKARQRHGLAFEQSGVVDIFYHPTDQYTWYNYATPRRGVAWVPGSDVLSALDLLGKHHLPAPSTLEVIEGLFPAAFHRQLESLGLMRDAWQYPLLTYGVVPDCDQQPFTTLPVPATPPQIATFTTTDPNAIGTWLRMHKRAADPAEIARSWANVADNHEVYLLASDDYVLAGGLALTLEPPLAELTSLYTTELYRRRGIGSALIRAATTLAQKRGCSLIFTIAEDEHAARLYRRLGYIDLDRLLLYRRSINGKQASPTHELAQSLS